MLLLAYPSKPLATLSLKPKLIVQEFCLKKHLITLNRLARTTGLEVAVSVVTVVDVSYMTIQPNSRNSEHGLPTQALQILTVKTKI